MHKDIKQAAIDVLKYCTYHSSTRLPRASGFGYPEPYTRDLMISAPGILVSGDDELIDILRFTLETLAQNLSPLGQAPSYVNQPGNLGAGDTTPLFLLALAMYRKATHEKHFLKEPAQRALTWMRYQTVDEKGAVPQQPTTDWRDEQWVPGFGLFVNTIVYSYLQMFRDRDHAVPLKHFMNQYAAHGKYAQQKRQLRGFALADKPCYALWTFKMYCSDRFDLLGNSLAILSGIASHSKAEAIINWVENECKRMQERGELAVDLPPNLIPIIQKTDPDWLPRYEVCNQPGNYHNGGIWPFICGFYVAALVAAGKQRLAERKLESLEKLLTPSRKNLEAAEKGTPKKQKPIDYGFNEWLTAKDGNPRGWDWQYWSAALYLYAAACVERGRTPFFDGVRE